MATKVKTFEDVISLLQPSYDIENTLRCTIRWTMLKKTEFLLGTW